MNETQKLIARLLLQACGEDNKKTGGMTIDNSCISSYEEACRMLTKLGVIEEKKQKVVRNLKRKCE